MIIKKIKWIYPLFFTIFSFVQGCASSNASRNAAASVDQTYIGIKSSFSTAGNIGDSYQNSSQTTKGVLIGGVTGGVVGGLSNGIGIVPGTVTGAILGGALGAYIDAHTTLVDKLQNQGAKVFVLGDQVLIVLPSSHTFVGRTPVIRHTAYSTLDLVTQLVGNYTNISVKVAGYTNAIGSERINLAISQEQAQSVVKYLWHRGVNTRLIYAAGYGGTHLVSKSRDWAKGDNYRIEITLEKLPV